MQQGILDIYRIVVHYYHHRALIENYKLILDWDSKWTSPNEESNFEDDPDIDGPKHTKNYLEWW